MEAFSKGLREWATGNIRNKGSLNPCLFSLMGSSPAKWAGPFFRSQQVPSSGREWGVGKLLYTWILSRCSTHIVLCEKKWTGHVETGWSLKAPSRLTLRCFVWLTLSSIKSLPPARNKKCSYGRRLEPKGIALAFRVRGCISISRTVLVIDGLGKHLLTGICKIAANTNEVGKVRYSHSSCIKGNFSFKKTIKERLLVRVCWFSDSWAITKDSRSPPQKPDMSSSDWMTWTSKIVIRMCL